MEILRNMGAWRKVIILDQSYLIENDNLPLLNVPAYDVRKITILTFTMPSWLKRQLLSVLLMTKYSKILLLEADNILLVNWFCLVMPITGNILMTKVIISSLLEEAINHPLPWHLPWEFGSLDCNTWPSPGVCWCRYKYPMGSLGLSKGKHGLGLFCTSQNVKEHPWRLAPRTYLWIYPEAKVVLMEMIIFLSPQGE